MLEAQTDKRLQKYTSCKLATDPNLILACFFGSKVEIKP